MEKYSRTDLIDLIKKYKASNKITRSRAIRHSGATKAELYRTAKMLGLLVDERASKRQELREEASTKKRKALSAGEEEVEEDEDEEEEDEEEEEEERRRRRRTPRTRSN